MEITTSPDSETGYTDLIVSLNPTQMALNGQPGWLDPYPTKLSWMAWPNGVKVFDQNGRPVGTAPKDSKVDFERHAEVYLVTFNEKTGEFLPHGVVPLAPK